MTLQAILDAFERLEIDLDEITRTLDLIELGDLTVEDIGPDFRQLLEDRVALRAAIDELHRRRVTQPLEDGLGRDLAVGEYDGLEPSVYDPYDDEWTPGGAI